MTRGSRNEKTMETYIWAKMSLAENSEKHPTKRYNKTNDNFNVLYGGQHGTTTNYQP